MEVINILVIANHITLLLVEHWTSYQPGVFPAMLGGMLKVYQVNNPVI